MNSDELTTGGLAASSAERKSLAIASTAYNAKDKIYVELFGSGPPIELFLESEARLNEITKKRLEKSQPPASNVAKKVPIPPSPSPSPAVPPDPATLTTTTTTTGTVRSTADAEGEKMGTVTLSKSAKKRAKEKEKARRQKEAADSGISYVASNDESNDEAEDMDEANDLVADMKISGDDR